MCWREQSKVSLRREFVMQAAKEESNMSLLCRRYQISRKTGYKWLNRYLRNGVEDLDDRARRPHHQPNKTTAKVQKHVMAIRQKHPSWGARKIRAVMERSAAEEIPAKSTIHKVLQRQGYISDRSEEKSSRSRFEHEAPNQLWQMDFKGHFAYESGRCHAVTIVDDHSRFSVTLKACANEQAETVKKVLIETFRRYGLPERINVDNGQPWGSNMEQARYTQLSVWIIEQGVRISYSRPYHPQTNGKDERFHRTLKTELLNQTYFRNLRHIQKAFDEWRDIYNLERPHEGINMQVPADRYKPSYRTYLERAAKVEYAGDYLVKKVDRRGRISIEGRQIFVGKPFSQKCVGVRGTHKMNVKQVYYGPQKLGEIDLTIVPKRIIINLYSGRVVEL